MFRTKRTEEASEAAILRARLYDRYRLYTGDINPADERAKRAPYLRRLISNHIPANRDVKILDLGCGNGLLLHFLREQGYTQIHGIDRSAEQINSAREQGFENVQSVDIFDFIDNASDESFDVIVAFDIIEHLTKSELLLLADEIYRVLKLGGLWLIHAPNAEGLFGSRVRYADLTHEQAFTRQSIEQLSRTAGFRSTECFEDEPVIHGLRSLARWFVWKALGALVRVYITAEAGERGVILSQNLLACARK